ncbi:MAG: hypothetical protein KDC34_14800 [Saprospiraceae bacterium]|nr:hypothetical protein [Saprospiraceae bacterium]
MKILYSLIIFLLTGGTILAQLPSDALRLSSLESGTTARTIGINGAINSLGADFSVSSTNPAGMAAYRKSEFTFSPAVSSSRVESILDGSNDNVAFRQSRSKFNLGNIGIVFANRPTGSNWKTANFAIGLNRMANFYSSSYYSGKSTGTITDRWVQLADGFTPDELGDFETGLAYDAGAIYNPFAYDNTLYGNDFSPTEVVDKAQIIQTTGSINELVFSLSGNYDEKLMLGLTVGVPIVDYEETKEYVESDEENKNPVFNELVFNEYLNTSGTGINVKMGFIYRPFQAFRIGGAVHTPTSYSLEDKYSNALSYDFGQGVFEAETPDGLFDYKIITPWKAIGSASFLFGKMGFISTEVEWIDYASASFNFNNAVSISDTEYEQLINQQIQDDYKSALNVRVGGELALGKLRVRAGYGILGSPYAGDSNSTGQSISGGIGIREDKFFLDLGYQNLRYGDTFVPYIVAGDNTQAVTNDYVNQKFLMTLGFKF